MEASTQSSSNHTPHQEDDKMSISLKIIKTVNFKIDKNETVGGLKALLHEKEEVAECLQELFFSGNHLKNDDKSLVDYGVSANSTLTAYVENSVPLRLSIKLPTSNRTIEVNVKAQDTIQNVKALINARENIRSDQYTLVFDGRLLEEDKTIAFLGIRDGSNLHLVFDPKNTLNISVKMSSGKMVRVQVKVLHTIKDLKTVIESRVKCPLKALTYEGEVLEDSKTLSYYNIRNESILDEVPQKNSVFISWCSRSTIFEVILGRSVRDLKGMIYRKFQIPASVQKLVFEGKILEDHRDLASYGIQKDSTIVLSARQATC